MKTFLIAYEPTHQTMMRLTSPVSRVEVTVQGRDEIHAQNEASSILGGPFHMYLQAVDIKEIS